MNETPTLREWLEIQRAHDTLVTVIATPELRQAICARDEDLSRMKAALDVLCWCLGHDHNKTFEGCLYWIEAVMSMHGYVMRNSGKLQPGEPVQ